MDGCAAACDHHQQSTDVPSLDLAPMAMPVPMPPPPGQVDDHWNFDFYHVEPAQQCMVDGAGRLVVDYVIR